MREILQRNSLGVQEEIAWPTAPKERQAPNQPPRPIGKIRWAPREPGSMGQYDVSHWYSVCQVNFGTRETFEAWTREPLTGGMRMMECNLPTYQAARELCQKDADEHYARGDR